MVLRGVPTNIRALIVDADGEPLKDKAVTVTVTKDSTGAAVVTDAEAGKTDASGIATYKLAAQATLDRFNATWTCEGGTYRTVEESVGLRLCSLAQVEEDVSETLSAETKRLARDAAEQFLEDECGVAWRPRYAHETVDGTGQHKLYLPHPKLTSVRSVTIHEGSEETTLTAGELEALRIYDEGCIWREEAWPAGSKNVEVVYEHGFANPPGAARRCAALLARHIATKRPSNLDDRATSYATDEASYTLITAGLRGNLTALPEVNAFLQSRQFPTV